MELRLDLTVDRGASVAEPTIAGTATHCGFRSRVLDGGFLSFFLFCVKYFFFWI